jgi:hypothetical protein
LLRKEPSATTRSDLLAAFDAFLPVEHVISAVDAIARRAADAGVTLDVYDAVRCCKSARRLDIVLVHRLLRPMATEAERRSPEAGRMLDVLMAYAQSYPLPQIMRFAALGFAAGVRDPCGKLLLHYAYKAVADDPDDAAPRNASTGNATTGAATVEVESDGNACDGATGVRMLSMPECRRLVQYMIAEAEAAGVHDPVNAVDCWGATPLQLACIATNASSSLAIVRALLEADADPNLGRLYSHWSPLHCACLRGHLHLVRPLLAAGADPLACDAVGFLAADFAATGAAARAAYLADALDAFETDTGPGPATEWDEGTLYARLGLVLEADKLPLVRTAIPDEPESGGDNNNGHLSTMGASETFNGRGSGSRAAGELGGPAGTSLPHHRLPSPALSVRFAANGRDGGAARHYTDELPGGTREIPGAAAADGTLARGDGAAGWQRAAFSRPQTSEHVLEGQLGAFRRLVALGLRDRAWAKRAHILMAVTRWRGSGRRR